MDRAEGKGERPMKILKKSRSLDPNPVMKVQTARELSRAELKKLRPKEETLTERQKSEALAYWRKYTRVDDAGWTDFYHHHTGVYDPRFVPHDIFYAEIDRVLNPPYLAVGLEDKILYPRLFPGIRQPKILISKANGALWNEEGEPLTENQAMELCRREERVVCKEPIYSCGGHGVRLFDVSRQEEELRKVFGRYDRLLVQPVVCQHEAMKEFNPTSLNTLRLMTYLRECGESVLISQVLRMGSVGAVVDNISSGGCSCGILPDGRLKAYGYSSRAERIAAHPGGTVFEGKRIPGYEEAVRQVRRLHRLLPQFGLLAWDIAIDGQGCPVLIEVNIGNASIDFMQLNNGPLFGEYTEEILERVYREPLTDG